MYKAKRGDLVVIERRMWQMRVNAPSVYTTSFRVMAVCSVTRDGAVKRVSSVRLTGMKGIDIAQYLFGNGFLHVISADKLTDADAALAAVAAIDHTFNSIEDVQQAFKPFKKES